MDILMTIKPHHLANIRTGKKKWELRRTKPKADIFDFPFTVYCCESGSGGKILAEFQCYNIQPILTEDCTVACQKACITENEFMDYIGKKDVIYAWTIDNVKEYKRQSKEEKHISEFGFSRPPQSWCYIKDGDKYGKDLSLLHSIQAT